jgi:hypothetical protein
MVDWKSRPTLIDMWGEEIDTIMAIDENGTNDLKGIRKIIKQDLLKDLFHKDELLPIQDRWFTISGVIFKREDFPAFRDSVNTIKYAHWDDGKFKYKGNERRVVFHSRDIRKKEGPFNPKLINYSDFMTDVSSMIDQTDFNIISSSIDKLEHVLKYMHNAYPVYDLCLEFIVERYCRELRKENKTGMLLLESRGKKEDAKILKHLVNLFKNGNNFWQPHHFDCIKGVYFNPKWSHKHKKQASFILLELADLVSYPIFKYVTTDKKDRAFEIVEQKLKNYPFYNGYGIKKFP